MGLHLDKDVADHTPSGEDTFRVGTIDRHLAIADFAQRARVLPDYADRRLVLFGRPRVVKPQDAIALGLQGFRDIRLADEFELPTPGIARTGQSCARAMQRA